MRTSIAVPLCFFLALASQDVRAANYHIHKKFEEVCQTSATIRCGRHGCTRTHMHQARETSPACQRSLERQNFRVIEFTGRIDPESNPNLQSKEASKLLRFAQTGTAKPNLPEGPSTKKSAPAPSAPAVAKWHKALLARLARYKTYAAQGNSAEGVVSLAFTVDRKGKIVSSRIEKTSGSTVLDSEALALLGRAAPLPAPPPEATDADLTLVLPIR